MSDRLSQETIDAFVIAAHHDLPQVEEMLAKQPELLNENADWMETAVQAASHVNRPDIINFLLDAGAPMDICTAAVLGRKDDVASMLAEFPDLVNWTSSHDLPVVYFAAIAGRDDILKLLIDTGADVSGGAGASTALHGAAGFGQIDTVRWLLANDANPYAEDFKERMPIDVASDNGYEDIVALLKPYTADADESGAGD